MEPILTTLADKVRPSHAAVLVVDMQNDFCDVAGSLGRKGTDMSAIRAMIPRLQGFLGSARKAHVPVVHIKTVIDDDDYSPAAKELWMRKGGTATRGLVRGSWGAEIVTEVAPAGDESVVEKTRYDAFIGTTLEYLLRAKDIKSVIVTGVATNVCVESTCRHAYMIDYYAIMPRDLVACGDQAAHEATLATMAKYFATVTSSADIVATWQALL